MARWDKIFSRGNVEDRRGAPQALGGLGVAGIVIYAVITLLGGGNLGDVAGGVLSQLNTVSVQTDDTRSTAEFEGADSYEIFASTVLGSANDMWTNLFNQANATYTPPKLVLFRAGTSSACGGASSDVGPHYCPKDQTIYIDETFFAELTSRFGATGGDVAEAYVIAHEVGHHIQNITGILENETDNESSIQTELQADCFAGLWANSVQHLGVFEPGEIAEAIDAAAAVGDDRIQSKVQGRINPESWTHGSSAQRVAWFNKGYETGVVANCNTF
ncbi:MAG TPA: neutral zinc metallopeptidase [Candidatus Paceibacterota bacterium]|nr:neutral zinc metallopeptidase [Candidatus Paceibacterota bacterium]